MRRRIIYIFVIFCAILLIPARFLGQTDLVTEIKDDALAREIDWLKAETYVITASKILQNIKKAPASISVITDKQIRQMGAKNLADVLARVVPGMTSWRHYYGQFQVEARGDNATLSLHVLLMINSHPVNNAQTGGWAWMYDTLPLDNVKRIEFVRGPGSALYGANAFAGVINVITKDAKDISGIEISASTGSENTQQLNLLYGGAFNDLDVVFNANCYKTDGFRGVIEEDYQTQIDRYYTILGIPAASLAPGRMKGEETKYDISWNVKYEGFHFDGKYIDRERDLPVGWLAALNQKSISPSKDYFMILGYEKTLFERFNIMGKLYRNVYDLNQDVQLFPPGHVRFNTKGQLTFWPEGELHELSLKASRIGAELQSTYKIEADNLMIVGVTYEKMKVADISGRANYLPAANPIDETPLPTVQGLPDEYIQDSESRDFKAVFMEHIWDITDTVCLTTGVRYDYYSDFGGAFSPRAGVTWEYLKGYDLKLLYGHAFRAPTFFELYDPFSGNPDLDPEEVDTYEISLGAEFSSLNGRLTFFYTETKDIIVPNSAFFPWHYVNKDERQNQGVELEIKYDFGKGTYFGANYTYIDLDDQIPGAKHLANVFGNIRLSRYLNIYADLNLLEDIQKWPSDTRNIDSGHETANITLIAKKFLKRCENFEIRASVYNLFDEDFSYYTGTGVLPNDLPAQGINYMLELSYRP